MANLKAERERIAEEATARKARELQAGNWTEADQSDTAIHAAVLTSPAAGGARPVLADATADVSKAAATDLPSAAAAADEEEDDDLSSHAEPASLSIGRGGMPPPLRGSLARLIQQDERLQADGLERIVDEDDLSARIAHHLLVPVPVSDALTVDDDLAPSRRYCRPWTARFLKDLARAHEAAFHTALQVNSAVRTVRYQQRLVRVNGNAAPARGDIFSPHLMGATIDLAKKPMSRKEIAWMRRRLLALEDDGKIDVEEEFTQACFHITVYRKYVPTRHTRRKKAVERVNEETAVQERAGQGG